MFAWVDLQNQVCDSARLNTKNFRQYYFMVIIPHINHLYTGLKIGKQILSCWNFATAREVLVAKAIQHWSSLLLWLFWVQCRTLGYQSSDSYQKLTFSLNQLPTCNQWTIGHHQQQLCFFFGTLVTQSLLTISNIDTGTGLKCKLSGKINK